MKPKKFFIVAIIAVFGFFIGGFNTASADSIDFPEDSLGIVSITFDENDNLVSASSPEVFRLAQAAQKGESNSEIQPKTVEYYAHSHWMYTTDHHNYFNGYKWGHSNFYHRTRSHSSWAKVGSKTSGWKSAKAGNVSKATAKGKGGFTPKRDAGAL